MKITKNIYVCGPTVYSEPHIGNMRPIIVFDLYIRALRFLGNDVNFIHNITDIDDKIIARAKQEGTTEEELSSRYHEQYVQLLKQLNVQSPNHMPTVMANIQPIIDFIGKLVENKKAYVRNGNVYFSVLATEGYGKLSNRKLEDMKYEEGEGKDNPADFVLWKNTTEGIKFDSPWGKGRPGWHTECVVFIEKHLHGMPLDLHGGGIDLLFPHHENENIQYKALYGNEIANDWKHVGHLNYEGEKMSKSIGNLISTSEFISKYGVDTLRYIFLTTSYSAPIDLTQELIQSAKEQVEKFSKIFLKSQLFLKNFDEFSDSIPEIFQNISTWSFAKAMKNISEILKKFQKEQTESTARDVYVVLKNLGFAFSETIVSNEIKEKYNAWNQARKNLDFEEADRLREELKNAGII